MVAWGCQKERSSIPAPLFLLMIVEWATPEDKYAHLHYGEHPYCPGIPPLHAASDSVHLPGQRIQHLC